MPGPFAFRQISTGQMLARWTNPQPAPGRFAHLLHVSQEYGIPTNDLERIEDAEDPRLTPGFILPPSPPDTRSPGRILADQLRDEGADPHVLLANPADLREVIAELVREL